MRNLLFPIYLIARLLKSAMFWIPISNFNRWKNNEKIIMKDLFFLTICLVLFSLFFLLNIWVAAICTFLFMICVFCLLYYSDAEI
jgi:hypothetical protein